MSAALLVAAATLGGEPQCNTDFFSCYYNHVGVDFGDDWQRLVLPPDYNDDGSNPGKSLCSKDAWRRREQCHSECPLRLVITSPPELAESFCVQDNVFSPYLADAHLDENHKLSGKEMELVAAPAGFDRMACEPTSFHTHDYTGKIALMTRGACWFFQKFVHARMANASMALMVNNQQHNDMIEQLVSMQGDGSKIPDFPAVSIAMHYGFMLFEALDKGTKVMAKMELDCGKIAPPVDPEGIEYDMCPNVALQHICAYEQEDEHRMCAKCPAEVALGGTNVCVWGNQLLPFAAKNSIWGANASPLSVSGAVAAMTVPGDGCAVSDYAGLAGKTVLMAAPQQCLQWDAVRRAEEAGVATVVFVGRKGGALSDMCVGKSKFVNIPVHFIDQTNYDAVFEYAQAAGTSMASDTGLKAWTLPKLTFVKGTMPPRKTVKVAKEPELAEAVAPESIATFAATPTVVVCLVFIVLLVAALGGVFVMQRANAVELPAIDGQKAGGKVPLGVASMALSLSLLVTVAVVAFVLATTAGQDATDTAVADGQKATAATYANAVLNVDDLAVKLRSNVIGRMYTGLQAVQKEGELMAGVVSSIYAGLDDSKWSTFYRYYRDLELVGRAARSGWLTKVWTVDGYFGTMDMVTDSRPDEQRMDGVNGTVAETNNGFLYGVAKNWWIAPARFGAYWWTHENWQESVFDSVGLEQGKVLDFVSKSQDGFKTWKVSKYSWYSIFWDVGGVGASMPVSVFQPIYNRQWEYKGVVEIAIPQDLIGRVVGESLAGKFLQNVTAVVFDIHDKEVVFTNRYTSTYILSAIQRMSGLLDMLKLRELTRVPVTEVNALSGVLDKHVDMNNLPQSNGMILQTTFEQREFYTFPGYEILDFTVQADGKWGDHSVEKHRAVLAGGASVVDDAELGHKVVQLSGAADSQIQVQQELMVDTPQVAETLTSVNPWVSTSRYYQWGQRALSDGKNCVLSEFVRAKGPDGTQYYCQMRKQHWTEPYSVTVMVKPDKDIPSALDPAVTPRLFTDTALGEGNIRLWGNGMLMMGVLRYGCNTPAFPNGLPGGQWAVITAVSDAMAKKCRVFLNGVLMGEGELSNSYSPFTREEPVLVGQNFAGKVARVLWQNAALKPSEVLDVYRQTTGGVGQKVKYNEVVPQREWYLDVAAIKTGSKSSTGLDFTVAVMMPQEDVMRNVDSNNELTTANLVVQEDNTNKKLTQMINEAIMVIVVVLLASVLVFLVFNNIITEPFAKIALVMCDAAVMKIDAIPEANSMLAELSAMQRAMVMMVRNLKEYKSYMPQSVILDDDDDESLAEESVATTMTHATGAAGRKASNASSRKSAMSRSKASRSSLSRSRMQQAQKNKGLMAVGLTKKKISFCVINVVDWLKYVKDLSLDGICREHAEMTSAIMTVFQTSKGVPETFSGDRYVCSFNAAKPIGTHKVAATTSAVHIMQTVGRKISCAVCGGDGKVGNLGTDMMKKFSYVSPLLSWAYCLERYSRKIGCSIVTDSMTGEDVKTGFFTRTVDQVLYRKYRGDKKIGIVQVVGAKEGGETDEWMYELEEAEKSDPHHGWNTFAQLIFEQKFSEAQGAMDKAKAAAQDPSVANCPQELLDKLCAAADTGVWEPEALVMN